MAHIRVYHHHDRANEHEIAWALLYLALTGILIGLLFYGSACTGDINVAATLGLTP